MDINQIKYAYFDLDGTLMSSPDEISEDNLLALNKMRKHGVKIGLISGRNPQFARKQIEDVKPDLPVVSVNGSVIISPDYNKIIYDFPLDKSILPVINKFVERKFDITIDTDCGFVKFAHLHSIYYDWLITRWENVLPSQRWQMLEINNLSELEKLCIYKVGLAFENEEQKKAILQMQPILPSGTEFLQSARILIDLIRTDVSKGNALKKLDGQYINLNETIVFGDNENDLSMFANAKFSVAMKNAKENVQKQATLITSYTNTENGVAQFINEYWPD